MGAKEPRGELVQGTLDLLILKALSNDSMHGWGIARLIEQSSKEVLRIEEGSLYPALRRLERSGIVKGSWSLSRTTGALVITRSLRAGVAGFTRNTPTGKRWSRR